MDLTKLVRKSIQGMEDIGWGSLQSDPDNLVLKWGCYPYGTDPLVQEDIVKSLGDLNKYPYLYKELKEEISGYTAVDKNNSILLNGSDKAFRLIPEVFIEEGDESIVFEPTFPVLASGVKMMGGKVIEIPLSKQFLLPSTSEIKSRVKERTKIIYIANPNNPTTNYITDNSQIEELLKMGIIVIIDEVYCEYGDRTALDLLKKYENLIILRSFSKTFGLAGLRVGYILTSDAISKYLKRVEETIEIFNVAQPALVGAISALKNIEKMKDNIYRVNLTKARLMSLLEEFGCVLMDSKTSFLFFKTEKLGISNEDFVRRMAEQKVIVKPTDLYKNVGKYWNHMGIPREEDFGRLEDALARVLGSNLED